MVVEPQRERSERACRDPLWRTDPLVRAVGEVLVLPDRHRRLQVVDQRPRRVERLAPVGRRRDHDHGDVPELQPPHPVHRGERSKISKVKNKVTIKNFGKLRNAKCRN